MVDGWRVEIRVSCSVWREEIFLNLFLQISSCGGWKLEIGNWKLEIGLGSSKKLLFATTSSLTLFFPPWM